MIEDSAMQLALRQRLLTLSVATTSAISLSASSSAGEDGASAFVRTTGSFIADGLRVGMEVKPSGFAIVANNNPATITHVSALKVTVSRTLVSEAASAGRTLVVGLPSGVSWENIIYDPAQGTPYIDEHYLPGPVSQRTIGPQGILEVEPMYVLNIYVPHGSGISADSKYTDALRVLFAPGTAIPLPNGDILRVRRDVAPTRSQRQFPSGFAVTSFSIPLRLHTANVI